MIPSRQAIYVVGPSATGKTTLCKALASRLDVKEPAFITEVARKVMRETGFSREDVGKLAMQLAILKAQVLADHQARAAVAENASPVLLSDRSAIDPIVYAYLSGDSGPSLASVLLNTEEFNQVIEAYRRSKFVLLTPIPEWVVDDGVRSLGDGRACFGHFRYLLKELSIPYIEIDGSCRFLEERVSRVIGFAQV